MMHKLFSMPLTKAYIITTIVATVPAVVFGLYSFRRLGGASDQAAALNANARSGGATFEGGSLGELAFDHNVWFWIAGVTLTFLFAGALIRIVLGNVTIHTVERMIKDMRAAATGDLSVDPKITMGNEYGDLQREFARLMGNFRSTITRIDRAARDLRQVAGEMSHTSDEAGGAIGEVAQAISAISEGASHQVELVGRSAQHIDSIDQAVKDAYEYAEEVRRQSTEASQLADAGIERAEEVERAMHITHEAAFTTASIVRELGERSQGIQAIVQSIADIAAQTNMLALNASIEAARAGNEGKGFANVADEVRVLAEDSQEAVTKIGEVVNEIALQTAGAIQAMEDGIAGTEASVQTVGESRQTFYDISNAIHQLGDRSAEISELSSEIVAAAARAREHVAEVAVVAEQSSASTQEVSASTEETSAAAEEVTASAQKVADTAAALADLSGRFKLPERSAA